MKAEKAGEFVGVGGYAGMNSRAERTCIFGRRINLKINPDGGVIGPLSPVIYYRANG